jgi:hypothetical protein
MTQATSRLHQPASKSLPHERIRGKREGICLPDAGPRGKRHFIKCHRQTRTEEAPEDHAEGAATEEPAAEQPAI